MCAATWPTDLGLSGRGVWRQVIGLWLAEPDRVLAPVQGGWAASPRDGIRGPRKGGRMALCPITGEHMSLITCVNPMSMNNNPRGLLELAETRSGAAMSLASGTA